MAPVSEVFEVITLFSIQIMGVFTFSEESTEGSAMH
jgi:hypothetical protein